MTTSVPIVAPRMRTTLIYSETVSLGGVTGFQEHQWNLNGLFDPNRTGGGHQPRGFDQITALYSRYRVYGVRYVVEAQFVSLTSAVTDTMLLGVVPNNSGTALTGAADAAESPYGDTRAFNLFKIARISKYIDLPKLNGKTLTAYMSDDTTQALSTANPTETIILHTSVANLSSNNTQSLVTITLHFDCEFSDPTALASS